MDAPPPSAPPVVDLFELVPPPPADPQAPPRRPGSLFSAGLAAITANYGGGDADQAKEPQGMFGSTSSGGNGMHVQLPSYASASGSSAGLMMAPLMAAAFRRPAGPVPVPPPTPSGSASSPWHPHPPPFPPFPYSASASSDPCTPFFPASSPYGTPGGGCFSPMSALDPLGVAFAWNFLGGTSDVIGYCSELTSVTAHSSSDSPPDHHHQLQPLLASSAYHPHPPPSASAPLHLPHPQQHIFHTNSFNFGGFQAESSSSSSTAAAGTSGGQKGTATKSGTGMPRAKTTTRKGGRRPREPEQHETPEDKDKRAKRRERNKQAAARCRRRREEKMESLQEQVAELKEQNDRREQEICKLREKEMRLLELLRLQTGVSVNPSVGNAVQRHQPLHLASIGHHPSVDHLIQASRPSAFLGGNGTGTGRKRGAAASTTMASSSSASSSASSSSSTSSSSGMKEEPDAAGGTTTTDDNGSGAGSTGTDESPMMPHAAGGAGFGMLQNGVDPVISESALPQNSYGGGPSVAKRPKFEQFGAGGANDPRASMSARPTTLQLNTLYREGFVANTPSKELGGGGHAGGAGSGIGFTPGSELITPGMSQLAQLTESGNFGVLMAQQTGLTPCQHGPVLIQQGGDRPPHGELSELR